jgi:hypothetical protein
VSLDAAAALAAPADVDVELPVDGPARDLDLELLGDVGLVERAAAVGAAVRQRCLVDLIDVGGGLAMSLGTVVRAGLTAGPLRLGLGRPLGEGGGLALAVPLCLFEEADRLGVGGKFGVAEMPVHEIEFGHLHLHGHRIFEQAGFMLLLTGNFKAPVSQFLARSFHGSALSGKS